MMSSNTNNDKCSSHISPDIIQEPQVKTHQSVGSSMNAVCRKITSTIELAD